MTRGLPRLPPPKRAQCQVRPGGASPHTCACEHPAMATHADLCVASSQPLLLKAK